MNAMSGYNYRVTNVSDELNFMDDDGLQRRFQPGQTQKTVEKPDGRESGWEVEVLGNPANPEQIENQADLPEEEE